MAYKPTGNPPGPPRLYNAEKVAVILEAYSSGEMSVREACLEAGVKPTTFLGWVFDDVDGVAERYARAQRMHHFIRRDEILGIIDDGTNDYVEKQGRSGTFIALDSEHVKRSELRCKYRLAISERHLPREFGGVADAAPTGQFTITIDRADSAL